MRGGSLTRQLFLCLLILCFLGDSPCGAGDIAGAPVENGPRTPSSSGSAGGKSGGQSGIVGKLEQIPIIWAHSRHV